MLRKTKGIVLSYIKYRDSSIICKVFTRELGLRTYVVNGVRSQKSQGKMALYQPLSLLDLVVYEREGGNLQRISEAKLDHAFVRLPFDFYRSGVALFMAEVLGKAIFEDYQNEELFDYIDQKVRVLDGAQLVLAPFPLRFLMELSTYLGIAPSSAEQFYEELSVDKASGNYKERLVALTSLREENEFKLSRSLNKALMDDWLKFYALHMDTFAEIKSLEVLRSLMGRPGN
jgi:DNA repair protein RecO (recombination protein O)